MCALYKHIPNRILVIDDDMDLLMLLERRLQKEGYEVETAASLPEAEEVISTFNPHLVLLDINVKGQDGRKLCWKLKMAEEDERPKVIIMSGYDYSRTRAALFGADDLLPKPLNLEFLLMQLSQHLFNINDQPSVVPVPVEKDDRSSFWIQLKSKLASIGDSSS
jgi:DNA-binding response OmpR family regulator